MKPFKRRNKNLKSLFTSEASLEEEYHHFYRVLVSESGSDVALGAAVSYFRRLFTERSEPPSYFSHEMIDVLLSIMEDCDRGVEVRTEAAWAITNLLCSKRVPLTHLIVQKGVLPILEKGIAEGQARFRDQCIWAVGNISADCSQCKEEVRETRILEAIARQARKGEKGREEGGGQMDRGEYSTAEAVKSAVWCSLNIIRGGRAPLCPMTARALLSGVSRALRDFPLDSSLLQDSLSTVSSLADDRNFSYFPHAWSPQIDSILAEPGLIDTAFRAIDTGPSTLVSPALRLLGNIVTGTDEQTENVVTRPGFMKLMVKAMYSESGQVRREAAWMVSNVAAGPSTHVDLITTETEMLGALLSLLHSSDAKLQKEVCWVFVNILSSYNVHSRPDDLEEILGYGVLRIVEFLSAPGTDTRIVNKAAEVLRIVLEKRPEWKAKIGEWMEGGDPASPITALYVPPRKKRPACEYLLVSYDYYKKK